jgi:hypothetical protein
MASAAPSTSSALARRQRTDLSWAAGLIIALIAGVFLRFVGPKTLNIATTNYSCLR